MRTTITLDDDVAAAVQELRRERSIGLSEAVNSLARLGSTVMRHGPPFRQQAAQLGLAIDVANISETLEQLDDVDQC